MIVIVTVVEVWPRSLDVRDVEAGLLVGTVVILEAVPCPAENLRVAHRVREGRVDAVQRGLIQGPDGAAWAEKARPGSSLVVVRARRSKR